MQMLPAPTLSSPAIAPYRTTTTCLPGRTDAEDFDDYNILQRDLMVDGGLRPVTEEETIAIRKWRRTRHSGSVPRTAGR